MHLDPLQFFSEQLARSQKGLQVAISTKNVQLAALNARQSFKNNLMCGLIVWRSKKNPTQHLQSAVEGLAEVALQIKQWDATVDIQESLPLSTSALLAKLVGATCAEAAEPGGTQPVEDQLDLLLLQEGREVSKVKNLLTKLQSTKRTHLVAESYRNYFEVLENKRTESAIGGLVRYGEGLFAKRATDSYYSGGNQHEGGGPDNALVVDYRLAVVLKMANAESSSLHAWQWSSGCDAA